MVDWDSELDEAEPLLVVLDSWLLGEADEPAAEPVVVWDDAAVVVAPSSEDEDEAAAVV